MNKISTDVQLDSYELNDNYDRTNGRVFLTGIQALVKLPLMQRQLDKINGLNTAGFVTGYRGSPLGGYDQALWKANSYLEENDITFLPGINEELAATAVMGTQQVEEEDDRSVDGVFSIWYGKGPGVDRAGDALKHGNAYGSSKNGGVLMIMGDDHGCVSSSMSHQSDVTAMSWYAPIIHPANVAEYIEYGLWGWALSRYSGMWVGFKAISEIVESAMSVDLTDLPHFSSPTDFTPPPQGLNFRWPDLPGMQIEQRMVVKKEAVLAFARANPIDKAIYNLPNARMGIITTGKAHLDLMEALQYLGINADKAKEIGLDIYKVGLVWPIEPEGIYHFLNNKEEVLVVEEKRGIIESQLKELLYDYEGYKPKRMVGKHDENMHPLLTWTDELSPSYLAPIVAGRLSKLFKQVNFDQALNHINNTQVCVQAPSGVKRLPYFCSGCPHNTSTKVPEGSEALAGIGCHFMASWMSRKTSSLIQMGGEGIGWVGKSRYLNNGHIFQNLGEGTYFHSGSLAIRQAIASKVNITYKILFNDATAMTGGQPIDGPISVATIAHQVVSEGASRVTIVSDEPTKYNRDRDFPTEVTFHHRDEMDVIQRQLRDISGTTILIYDQTCAAEKRRLRKRKQYPDPPKRVFINDLVCEGCGDCSNQSNCLSIFPKPTEFGPKRKIDQSSCNKDYSCVKGFCPSFVTVEGGQLRKPKAVDFDESFTKRVEQLDTPDYQQLEKPFDLLVGGVGGTGVVTVGSLVTMAAHLEGKGASVLDFMGFAQKGGTVMSFVRIGKNPQALNQVRIDTGMADAMIACDMIVGTDPRSLKVLRHGQSKVIVNLSELPSGDFVMDRNADMQTDLRVSTLRQAVGDDCVDTLDANKLAEKLLGNTVFSNVFLLGYAWQKGIIPLSLKAMERAIELNNVAIDKNKKAFNWGRIAAEDLPFVLKVIGNDESQTIATELNDIISKRETFLTQYQNKAYAKAYTDFVAKVKEQEKRLNCSDFKLTETVARYLFKVMAYKDEYEVARLFTDGSFIKQITHNFEGDYTLKFHMAPPLLSRKLDAEGRPRKKQFGPWMYPALKVMAKLKFLRGSKLDIFGYSQERQSEIKLIEDYKTIIESLFDALNSDNLATAIKIAEFPDQIRGYGPVKEKALKESEETVKHLLEDFADKTTKALIATDTAA
ncbi:MAG: indolepyruvate ferredoxin oxidoreductase family protein [Arenicella sp.]